MLRSSGTATIAWGMVSIPVKLYTVAESAESVNFRMLHAECCTPVKQQYICPKHQQALERDDIVKGYEYAKDRFVTFTPDELEALAERATQAVTVNEFVRLNQIDPVYFDRAYYLAPEKVAERAYALLSATLHRTGLVGLGTYGARGKEYLAVVRGCASGLILQNLHYAAEIRTFSQLPVFKLPEIKQAELDLALRVVEASTSPEFEPGAYHDTAAERAQEAIQAKIDGTVVAYATAEAPAQIINLVQALKASLETRKVG